MKFWPVRFILVISSFLAQGQQSELSQLLDSARELWYKDFDKTNQLLNRAEQYLGSRNDSSSIQAKLAVFQCRLSSCQAFNRYRLWKENLERIDKFLLDHKDKLGNQFDLLHLENELALAMYYVEIHDHSRALPLLVHVQETLRTWPQTEIVCHNLFLTTNYLAAIYLSRGEHIAAINQNLAGLPYFNCFNLNSTNGYDALIYRNVGLNYIEIGDFTNARKYLNLAENVIREPLKKDPESLTPHALALFESQALLYQKAGNSDSALISLSKALPLLSLRTVRDEFKGRISLSMANLYFDRKDYTHTLYYLRKAEAYFSQSGEQNSTFLADIDLVKADLLTRQNRIDEGLKYCDYSIDKLTVNFRPEGGNRLAQKVLSNKKLFKALQIKSRLMEKLYLKNQQVPLLKEAAVINQQALALLDSITTEFSLDEDRIILTRQSYDAFESGIRMNNLLYQLTGEKKYADQVFSLMEMSKGVLLLENLRLVNRFSGVSEEWLSMEKEKKSEILAVEKSLYEIELGKGTEDQNILRQRYAELKHEYNKLIEQFKQQSPHYYRLRFDHSVVSAEAIQKQLLRPDEALVEFFVGDSLLAVVGFTTTRQYLLVKPLPPDFTGKLNEFRKSLVTSSDSGYSRYAHGLYEFLLKECLREIGQGIRSLIIIPDGMLGYIPFEVMIPGQEKNNTLNNHYAIRYAYSATYLSEQLMRKTAETKYFFAGFVASGQTQEAPRHNTRHEQFGALRGAEYEVASIVELIRKKSNIFNPAVKTDFIRHAPDYAVLHLAMHSVVNDKNPMMSEMIFADDDSALHSLTAIELYSMQLNSRLAVLSACNTGIGQLHRGEGIMSFSRAFAYAGVPAALISLWKVPDEATAKIMVNFYNYLKAGESKDRALQLARQDFVRDNPELAHPYFWSGFILTGTADPIEFPSAFQWHWFIAGLLVILVVGYGLRKYLMPGRFLSKSL